MAEFLVQDVTMTALANQARRISGSSDALNAAEMIEVFSRTQGSVNQSGNHLVEIMDNAGKMLKTGTYNSGEICALPSEPNNVLFEFDKWIATVPVDNDFFMPVNNESIKAYASMKSKNDALVIKIYVANNNTSIKLGDNSPHFIFYHYSGVNYTIDWGDGSSSVYDDNHYGVSSYTHTYSYAGIYYIRITAEIPERILTNIGKIDIYYGIDDEATINSIEEIHLPTWVKVTIYQFFCKFPNLKSISNLKQSDLQSTMFYGCSSLKFVSFSSDVTTFPGQLFYQFNIDCGLTDVVIPYGVTSIPNKCFSRCNNLKNVVIPASVTSIGSEAFYRCNQIEQLSIYSPVDIQSIDSFYGCTTLILAANDICNLLYSSSTYPTIQEIYVPDNLLDSYKNAQYWEKYASKIKPISEYVGTY